MIPTGDRVVKRASIRTENAKQWTYHGQMIEPAPGATEDADLRIAGKGFVHSRPGAEIEEVRRRPDIVLGPGPDAVEDGGVDGVGVFLHAFVRRMHGFSDESKHKADFLLGEGNFLVEEDLGGRSGGFFGDFISQASGTLSWMGSMKKLAALLLWWGGFLGVLSAATPIAGEAAGIANPADADLGVSRFFTNPNPTPSAPLGSKEWLGGNSLTGDWSGFRNRLDERGVEFSASYTSNFAGNPVGGITQAFAYAENYTFGLLLDFGKMQVAPGLKMMISGLDRNGSNLSARHIGNQFTVQQVYGTQTVVFYAFYLEQSFLDDQLSLKVGRFSTGDEFAASPIYWLHMSNGIDGNPQSLPVNTAFSTYPGSVWAARVRVDPDPEWFGLAGIYQATKLNLYQEHGLDWSLGSSDGILLIAQAGWTPEFLKKPVASAPPPDGKSAVAAQSLARGKTSRSPSDAPEMLGLPGHYWVGAYYSSWKYPQFNSGQTTTNSYGFYAHADQMISQETPGSEQGLTLWAAAVLSPQQNIAKLPFQVNAGLFYTGLLPSRDNDIAILGFACGNFSKDFAQSVTANPSTPHSNLPAPTSEIAIELGYRYQFTQFACFQPNLQWIIRPGGSAGIPNALVIGAQINVTF